MTLEIDTRRGFLVGALALMAAPAIVRASSLMPVKAVRLYPSPNPTFGMTMYEVLQRQREANRQEQAERARVEREARMQLERDKRLLREMEANHPRRF